MLLHESLKYPSLEKVVGLELDQTVTRKAFKYFRTQPHFDDERVEWWFGDATKSLLLLPEDYWGSFDLVLVDLSETVMAFSVTDDLDVFDALALLVSFDVFCCGAVLSFNFLFFCSNP
jgi:spermidine synthase